MDRNASGQVLASGEEHNMEIKWIGAALIVSGCSGAGFYMACGHKFTEFCIEQLLNALEFMIRELEFRLPALPDLLSSAGRISRGPISSILKSTGYALEHHRIETPSDGIAQSMSTFYLPGEVSGRLLTLGDSLGRFDLQGQLQGLCGIREDCKSTLRKLREGREQRLRSYQTLGICAGAALAIILL